VAWGWLKVRSGHFPARWEWLNRSSGALLVILTLAYCMGTCLQWRAINEANRNANTALVAQRATIKVTISSFDPATDLFGEAVLVNTGQTLARDIDSLIQLRRTTSAIERVPPGERAPRRGGPFLGPGATLNVKIPSTAIPKNDADAIARHKMRLYAVGFVVYEDIFNGTQIEEVCFLWVDAQLWASCDAVAVK
jgi:hypothetical protein